MPGVTRRRPVAAPGLAIAIIACSWHLNPCDAFQASSSSSRQRQLQHGRQIQHHTTSLRKQGEGFDAFKLPASRRTHETSTSTSSSTAPSPAPPNAPSPSVVPLSSPSFSSSKPLEGTLLETRSYFSVEFLAHRMSSSATLAATGVPRRMTVESEQKQKAVKPLEDEVGEAWLRAQKEVEANPESMQQVEEEEELVSVGVISHHEALELLCLREGLGGRGGRGGVHYHDGVSLDLGRSETMVVVTEEGIAVPVVEASHPRRPQREAREPALVATWGELEDIVDQARRGRPGCFTLYTDGTQPWKISAVSLQTGRAANLLPSLHVKGPPTVVLGSYRMHRLDGPRPGRYLGPAEDTRRKLDAIKMKKVYGKVLDTTTGLGYTAIAAARCAHVTEVVTVEADQAALEMSRYNPWSTDLFSSASVRASQGLSPIHMVQGDVCELIHSFRDNAFAAVMHDPPSMALSRAAVHLYSPAFYAQLYRVLRWRGRLFHFVGGHPKAKENARLYKMVVQRLEAAGFKKVMILASAQGVVAEKGEDRKSKKALHARNGSGERGSGGKAQRLRAQREFMWGMDFLGEEGEGLE